ncbi:MAG: tetratricopeptide repeat protein [Planctomycetes bacterium]|nr:tetratricopeptide repeat protein [Planctomycetota bacterium]
MIIDDVWSRTEPKYRTRAIVLLIANMALFGGMCCFMYWLRYGWPFPPTHEEYVANFQNTLNFAGHVQITLHDLFMQPISLQLVPMQSVVIGLLIATLVSIPILVSILYRFRSSIPFCVMVSVLAVMPWLGVTLLLSCLIAAYGRLKLKFRFAAALLGLVPIGVYFFTASRGSFAPEDVLTPQIERGLVVAPLLMSALASCALMVVVLTIARVVDYRPGAIAPLLAIMFLTPWFLFMQKVGRDELHYRLFERHYGPQSVEYFAAADAGAVSRRIARRLKNRLGPSAPPAAELERAALRFFQSQRVAADDNSPPAGVVRPEEVPGLRAAVEAERLEYLQTCARWQYRVDVESDKFLRDFPTSRYRPCVLYIKGRALDMRIDSEAFQHAGVLRFHPDFPSVASRAVWDALASKYPDSPLAKVARFRLARLHARSGNINQAILELAVVADSRTRQAQGESQSRTFEHLLAKKPPEASLEDEHLNFEERASGMLELLRYNRNDAFGDAPLIAYLNCDARHAKHAQNLAFILQRFPDCAIADNIELQRALARSHAEDRVHELKDLRRRFPDGDTSAEVLFRLGAALAAAGKRDEARKRFQELISKHAQSRFVARARHAMLLGGMGRMQAAGG